MKVYGIRNCNTVKSALEWLNRKKVDFEFHDYKSKGITEEKLRNWSKQVGWETLINKKGTTWRQLDEKAQKRITSEKNAIVLMLEKNSVIKRPVLERDGKVITIGFDEDTYTRLLSV